jgi:hypothetical protein
MKRRRAHIWLPQELLSEIDEIVGPRGCSAFLLETAREALKRRKLLRFLASDDVVWKDENHPELAKGTAEWVRGLRQESEARGNRKKKQQSRAK